MKTKEVMIKKKEVKTIKPSDKLATAKLIMSRNNIGGLPVIDEEQKVIGFITLRDIYLPSAPANLLVKEIMTDEVLTKKPDTEIKEIAKIMKQTGLQRIPIVDNEEKLRGLVTQTSLINIITDLL